MPKRSLTTRIQRGLRNTIKQLWGAISSWVRRSLRRRPRHRRIAGFVLPTTALLLLLMSLVVGALLIRTFNRTEQVVGARQQRVIYNATAPAIERGKAKLEYLFSNDPRVTTGVPSQEILRSMMLNDGSNDQEPFLVDGNDPYTLPDETRLDINGGGDDTAWSFPVDLNGDGQIDEGQDAKVAYSLIWRVPDENDLGRLLRGDAEDLVADGDADGSFVRRGPVVASSLAAGCNLSEDIAPPIENGWFREEGNTSTLRKNFQIDAVLIPDDPNVNTQATLEVQQERQSNRGNKWGAWFRTDLEVHAGPPFRWNGAMHTEGNYFLTKTNLDPDGGFQGYLVSSRNSCLYSDPSASELTMNEVRSDQNDDTSTLLFQGQAVQGWTWSNAYVGDEFAETAPLMHVHQGGSPPLTDRTIISVDGNETSDSVTNAPFQVADLMLNPLAIVTENKSRAFSQAPDPSPDNPTPYHTNIRDGDWAEGAFNSSPPRILNVSSQQPFIDDIYRADGRLGPKPTYGRNNEFTLEDLGPNGTAITTVSGEVQEALMKMSGSGADDVGLDGYWERRAVRGGMRIVVGQRLELGDPLQPLDPNDSSEENYPNHYERQRRTLRDNLAAVQATAIYHSSHGADDDGGTPYAALITTVHPGTPDTLARSATFEPLSFDSFKVKTDYTDLFGSDFGDHDEDFLEWPVNFFRGLGTNGWEFQIPNDFENDTALGDSALVDALFNLAYFAGDPEGAFPPTQENGAVHPIPELTEWGDFSGLRRALFDPQGAPEARIADNSYMQTAAMLVGALAYNVSYLDAFDYEAITNRDLIDASASTNDLYEFLQIFRDGDIKNGEVRYYPDEDLNGNGNCNDSNVVGGLDEDIDNQNANIDPDTGLCDPVAPSIVVFSQRSQERDPEVIARIPVDYPVGDPTIAEPEAYLVALEDWLEEEPNEPGLEEAVDLARLVIDKEQVDRDRKFGFKATPKITWPRDPILPDSDDPASLPGRYQYSVRFTMEDADNNGQLDRAEDINSDGRNDADEDLDAEGMAEGDTNEDMQDFEPGEDLNGDNVMPFSERNNSSDPMDTDYDDVDSMPDDPDDVCFTTLRAAIPVDAGNPPIDCAANIRIINTEDINGNGSIDTNISEDINENEPSNPDPPNPDLGEDVNANGNLDTDISEDLNGNGVLDINEDTNANGAFEVDDEDANGNTIWDTGLIVNFGCDFSQETGNNFFGFGEPTNLDDERRFITLASALCPSHPKYPALYYLFPKDEHGYIDTTADLDGNGIAEEPTDEQPFNTEDFNRNGTLDYGEDLNRNGQLDGDPIVYLSRDGTAENAYLGGLPGGTFEAINAEDLSNLAIGPKKIDDWVLPYSNEGDSPPSECSNDADPDNPNPNCSQYNLVVAKETPTDNYSYYRLGLKDTAFFEGRELMSLRFLNVDLEMLTNKADGESNGTVNGENWIPVGALEGSNITGGIVYTAREDAVREDAVARPASTDWDTYQQSYQQNYGTPNENLRMNADVPQDPPVSDPQEISPKPIDFYPDPDRRGHGFRLINGRDLSRGTNVVGMTWVTDNRVFIKGDFNCHGECSSQIEEFSDLLTDNYSNFYTRSNLNIASAGGQFTDPGPDSWRTTEILADASGIQSDRFCDGSIADPFVNVGIDTPNLNTILQNRYGCDSGAQFTSYFNHGPVRRFQDWVLENPAHDWQAEEGDSVEDRYETLRSPIKISDWGNPFCTNCIANGTLRGNYWEYDTHPDTAQYFPFNALRDGTEGRHLIIPQTTFVNAALFSGVIPSREGQPNSGLHNFPRFLEDWTGIELHFSGSLMQLNFSNAATGPIVLSAWEPDAEPPPVNSLTAAGFGSAPAPGASQFYIPPNRVWGYDVAMQLVPAAPVAQRLLAVGNARSEFYSEPEADDPYIKQLRCTVDASRPGC